jgi:mannobiose 2-epimerase
MPRGLLLSLLFPIFGCIAAQDSLEYIKKDRNVILSEMQGVLDKEIRMWYPLCLDTVYGGYYSDIDYQWKLDGQQNKMIVTQARHLWSASNALLSNTDDSLLLRVAAHGFDFLRHTMWDSVYGGFYDLVDRRGMPLKEDGKIIKRAYGNAFGIYALAAYYRVSGDTAALHLAQEAWGWLEKHSFDLAHGGYFQFVTREGTPFTEGYNGTPPKDQNSTIHLLEAFTELYDVWPEQILGERLGSLLYLVRDVITTDAGYMRLFFSRDWIPVSRSDPSFGAGRMRYDLDHISFGHDIETAYLIIEASRALNFTPDPTTLRIAKRKVDFVISHGWDARHGGIYDRGSDEKGDGHISIIQDTKEWWAQAEAYNSLLLMSRLFPDDSMHYFNLFDRQWQFCTKYMIDSVHGGWFWGGLDKDPNNLRSPKGSIWKADYHTTRSLSNCIRVLEGFNGGDFLWTDPIFAQRKFEPVNENATPEARKLLKYLYSIRGRRIIAGHHNDAMRPDTFITRVRELTGKSPQVWGCDFINYYRQGNPEKIVQEALKKYKAGYIITMMWHAGRPKDDPPFGWKESVQAKLTDDEWKELITPGTNLNMRWTLQVDTVAAYLAELQKLGVPILWRPYHELNGVWFWWGNRKGPDGSARLWRMLYDRFVHHHKLNNLIWVWNTNAPRLLPNDEAWAYEDYFPGLEYVDVLAADVYHSDYKQSHHDKLVQLGQGKIIALGEVGEVPTPAILARQPMWTWFMIWGNFVNSHNTPEQIRNLYSCPRVLGHEDAPAL